MSRITYIKRVHHHFSISNLYNSLQVIGLKHQSDEPKAFGALEHVKNILDKSMKMFYNFCFKKCFYNLEVIFTISIPLYQMLDSVCDYEFDPKLTIAQKYHKLNKTHELLTLGDLRHGSTNDRC